MEERRVTISRAKVSIDYPANFMLVASMNPCPCGYGGLPEDGTPLAEAAPRAEELAAAEEAAAAAGEGVTAAEHALVATWNKDGDAEKLLDMARAKLEPYQDEIAATVEAKAAGTDPVTEEEAPDDDLAETPGDALPEDGVVVETPLLLPAETTGG